MNKIYDDIITRVLSLEGRWVNDHKDSGGETYMGITRRDFPNWDGWTILDAIPVKAKRSDETAEKLTPLVKKFYWDEFYAPMNISLFKSPKVCFEVFDTGVNMGKVTAAQFLQRVGNVLMIGTPLKVDGKIGKKTAEVINELTAGPAEESAVLKALNVLQGYRYFELCEKYPKNERFIRGWLNHRIAL